MDYIGKKIKKVDSSSLLQGRKCYTDDLAPENTLVIKLLRSPHPHANIVHVDTEKAKALPGVECVYTHKDVPKTPFTLAGQSYPEPSPYDRYILNDKVRYVGDPVAIIAAVDEKTAKKALKLIKVEYELLPPILDFEKAEESAPIHDHPKMNVPQSVCLYDFEKNIIGGYDMDFGEDVDKVYENSPVKIDQVYYTQAQSQSMMETFRSYCYIDFMDRLVCISSTQVPFHIKRQLSQALEISPGKIRVIKPRIGGAFGAKQTSESEVFPAFVTWMTKKPSKIVYTRTETTYATNSRHKTKIRVKLGAERDGTLNSIDMDVLSDQGAYGTHAWTTLKLMGEKAMPMYRIKAGRFHGKVVYTNKLPGGAFRGYGATQGCFALESAINEMADALEMDPTEFRLKNITIEGDQTIAFNKDIRSSRLNECIERGKELIHWDEYYPNKKVAPNKIQSVGMAIAMQGSGIAAIDSANAQIKLNESGDYSLFVSCTDAGTGTDTIVQQIAGEILKVPLEDISVISADTDVTPYDPGSYASSGVYTTGNAVYRCAKNMINILKEEAGKIWDVSPQNIEFHGSHLSYKDQSMAIKELATILTTGIHAKNMIATGSFGNDDSPPPFMAGFALVETDLLTGDAKVLKYAAVVDCGTVINKNLATVQTEGGIVQGVGLALYEDVRYNQKGKVTTDNFMTYHLPTRLDSPKTIVEFKESFEPTGPFGAKSIGEIVINTPAPAIAHAIHNGVGKYFRKLPVQPEDILL
ncbi:MAG: molybdopterin-dependent oxidoreductase [Tissierellia bacterium]|nr:molybdopterin-dependent oxidoreductase [Tissierellia bacterium]